MLIIFSNFNREECDQVAPEFLIFISVCQLFPMSVLEDQTWIKALKQSDKKAFDAIYYRCHKKLFAFSLKFLKDRDETEDLIQKVVTILWERRQHLDENKSVEGYLFRIVRNEIYDILKLRAIRGHYSDYVVNSQEADLYELEKKKMIEHVFQLIDHLPERRAQIFRMSKEDGLTYRQIAEILHISENTVDTQIRHSLDYLRKEMHKLRLIILSILP